MTVDYVIERIGVEEEVRVKEAAEKEAKSRENRHAGKDVEILI